MQARVRAEVDAAVKRAEEIPAPPVSDLFNSMYAELPASLVHQRDTMQTHSLASEQTAKVEGH